MEKDTYKYDVFISYRHIKPDADIAAALHRMLETFRVPKASFSEGWIGRSFIDREELTTGDLSESIVQALKQSRYLISVCSGRTRFSPWCMKEIELFKSLHGEDKILILLLEGEPEDSFPEMLKNLRKSGTEGEETRELLAADIRPAAVKAADFAGYDAISDREREKYKKESLKLLRETEIYRIMAGIFGLSYGDLRQRRRERRLKLLLAGSGVILAFLSVFALLLFRMYIRAAESERRAKQQTALMILNYADSAIEKGDRLYALLIAEEAMDYTTANMEEISYINALNYSILNRGLLRRPYAGITKINIGRESPFFTLIRDGEELLTLGEGNRMEIWNVENALMEKSIEPPETIMSLAASQDGSVVVSSTVSGKLLLWDIASGSYTEFADMGKLYYTELLVTKDGRFLIGLANTPTFRCIDIWNVESKEKIYSDETEEGNDVAYSVMAKDGRYLSYALYDTSVTEVDLQTGEAKEIFSGVEGKQSIWRNLAYSDDGRYLYRCLENTLYRYDRRSGEISEIALSTYASGIRLYKNYLYIAGSGTSDIQLFNLDSMEVTGYLEGRNAILYQFMINENDGTVVSVWSDDKVYIWDNIDFYASNALGRQIEDVQDSPSAKLQFDPKGEYLFNSAAEGSILIMDVKGNAQSEKITGNLLAQSRNYRYILLEDGEHLYVYDSREKKNTAKLKIPQDFMVDLNVFALSSDGRTIALSDFGLRRVELVDVDTKTILASIPISGDASVRMTTDLAFSEDDTSIYAAFSDGSLEKYGAESGEKLQNYESLGKEIKSIVLSEGDDLLALNTIDKKSRVIQADGSFLEDISGEIYSVYRESRKIKAIGLYEDDIFHYTEGEELRIIPTNNLRQGSVSESLNTNSISPDKKYLLTNIAKGNTVLTDVETGVYVQEYGYTSTVFGRAYFTEGAAIVYDAGEGFSVIQMIYTPEELEKLAEDALGGRRLSEEELEKIGKSQ